MSHEAFKKLIEAEEKYLRECGWVLAQEVFDQLRKEVQADVCFGDWVHPEKRGLTNLCDFDFALQIQKEQDLLEYYDLP